MKIAVEIGFSFKRDMEDAYGSLELRDGATVLEAFRLLGNCHPIFQERVFDGTGSIRRNINALINGSNVQFRECFDTVLIEGDRLSVLPPVGGG